MNWWIVYDASRLLAAIALIAIAIASPDSWMVLVLAAYVIAGLGVSLVRHRRFE